MVTFFEVLPFTTVSILVIFIYILLPVKNKLKTEGSLTCILGLLAFSLLWDLALLQHNNEQSIPVMTFTVVDKRHSVHCPTPEVDSCKDAYNLILKTDKGYIFSQMFTPNTYYKFNIGDKISYKPDYSVYLEINGK